MSLNKLLKATLSAAALFAVAGTAAHAEEWKFAHEESPGDVQDLYAQEFKRLVEEKTDWRWRDVDTLRIEEVWMNVYHGGTDPAPQDLVLYIDNVVIATEHVGPMVE